MRQCSVGGRGSLVRGPPQWKMFKSNHRQDLVKKSNFFFATYGWTKSDEFHGIILGTKSRRSSYYVSKFAPTSRDALTPTTFVCDMITVFVFFGLHVSLLSDLCHHCVFVLVSSFESVIY